MEIDLSILDETSNGHSSWAASMHSLSQDQPSFVVKMKYTMEGNNSPEQIQR